MATVSYTRRTPEQGVLYRAFVQEWPSVRAMLTASPIRVSAAFPAMGAGLRELPAIMRRRPPGLARCATADRACEHATL